MKNQVQQGRVASGKGQVFPLPLATGPSPLNHNLSDAESNRAVDRPNKPKP